jgi:hypothetical protein
MLVGAEFDLAVVVEADGQAPVGMDRLNRGQVAICNAERFVGRGELDAVAHRDFSFCFAIDACSPRMPRNVLNLIKRRTGGFQSYVPVSGTNWSSPLRLRAALIGEVCGGSDIVPDLLKRSSLPEPLNLQPPEVRFRRRRKLLVLTRCAADRTDLD